MKKLLLLFLLVAGGVSTASADEVTTTIYYAVPAATVNNGSYTVELNMKYGSKDGEWKKVTMSNISKTYYGNYIYSGTITLNYGGYYNLQFLVNGGLAKETYAGDWNTDVHNGEMYDHNAGWRKYNYDKTVTIHAFKKAGWSEVYICNEFNDYGEHWDTQVTFPGTEGTQSTINGNWYDLTVTGRPCTRVVTSNGYDGEGNRSGNCEIGDAKEYWITYDGSTTSCVSTLPATFNYTRTGLTDGKYGTICLPYAVSAVSGATFYEIASKTATEINLNEVAAPAAGTPYIFQASSDSFTATLSGNYTAATSATGLVGNISSTPIYVPVNKYIISNNKVQKVVSGEFGVTCGQYRAYVDLDDVGAGSRGAISIAFADETTGINNLTPALNEGVVYDLQGRKVAQPTKGLYIVNGKKVIK